MAFGFGRMSGTQSRMGSMGMGNRPGDAPSLGGRFGGQGQAPPSGGRFGIGPSKPPMMPPAQRMPPRPMPPQSKGNAFGRMNPQQPMRRIVRPPMGPPTGMDNGMGGQVQLPPPMQGGGEMAPIGGMSPRPDLMERIRAMMGGGGGPMRGFN